MEDKVYKEPAGWKFNETLTPPFVVRFIHDSGIVDSDLIDGTAPGPNPPGPDPHPWELYLIQSVLYLCGNFEYTGPYTVNFLPQQCGHPNGPYVSFNCPEGYINGDLGSKYHIFINPVNSCEHYNNGEYFAGPAGDALAAGILRQLGWKVWFNWRKQTGPTSYDYFTAAICPDLWPASDLNSVNRTTPIYFEEFPWMVNPAAPHCPASGGP